ncbi:MAG: enoyl-CoA hydratase/isomerase family protein [Deltaproteobacteria bacterium]|nr:enoyl-CoA hydratase/isomerase family protein [Deltaproteobacteria bacterium]
MNIPNELKTLTFEEIEPSIALITMNRPEQLNAQSVELLAEFDELFRALSDFESTFKVVIITGAGRAYCAGADLNDAVVHKDTDAFKDPELFLKIVQERYANLILGMRRIPQPIISAINGPAAGGGFAMTLASDVRIAVPEAYFVASFINIGLSGGELGCSYYLPRLVGLARASDVLLTGRKVGADEAERIGLVNKVVPREDLLEEALSYARLMTAKSYGALKLTKRVLDQNIDAPSLEAAVNVENRNQAIMVFSGAFFKLIQSFFKGGEK